MRPGLPAELTRQWDETGTLRLDGFLAPPHWAAVCDELCRATLPMTEIAQPLAITRRANLDTRSCKGRYPALLQLISNQHLLDLLHYAAEYRGRPVVSVQCVHSDGAGGVDPQTDWHVDTFHSTAKAWLFLHPVAADERPMAYLQGSRGLTERRLAWEWRASEVAASHANRLHARGSSGVVLQSAAQPIRVGPVSEPVGLAAVARSLGRLSCSARISGCMPGGRLRGYRGR